jgi:hypothetical protein
VHVSNLDAICDVQNGCGLHVLSTCEIVQQSNCWCWTLTHHASSAVVVFFAWCADAWWCCCWLQEPNHHKTYVVLLDALAHKDLSKNVLSTTYYYCRCGSDSYRKTATIMSKQSCRQRCMCSCAWLVLLVCASQHLLLLYMDACCCLISSSIMLQALSVACVPACLLLCCVHQGCQRMLQFCMLEYVCSAFGF